MRSMTAKNMNNLFAFQAGLAAALSLAFAAAAQTNLPGAPGGEFLVLAQGGASDYVIVVPDGDDPRERVHKAASLLRGILAEAAACDLSVCRESEAPAGKPRICLGKTAAAMKAGLPLESLAGWSFCKRVVGKNLYLAGRDESAGIAEKPEKEYLGTFKAVTSFLEDEVGVRFLLPGTNGTYVPALAELKVSANLNVTASARIPYCYGRFYGDISIAHNHFDIPFYKTYGGHSYYEAVPVEKYAETHPEYFVLSGGKRVPAFGKENYQRNHLCISNPEVRELMLQEMEKQLDLGYEWVQLAQTDGYRACECEKCKAIAGDDKGEALWIVHRSLAEEMQKRRAGKKIVILSYGPTRLPPKTFDKFPDNVVIEMCSYAPEDFEKWKTFNVEKLVYIYNWGTYHPLGFLPKRSPAYCAKQLRLFAENNVRGIYKCGFGDSIGLEGPVYYVYGKLLFDPSADPRVLADEFYRAAYGRASSSMKYFFDALYKRLDDRAGGSIIDVLPQSAEDHICHCFPPELVQGMERHLKIAFKRDSDPRVQARLRLVQREFEYLKNLSAIFAYYRAFRAEEDWEVFDLMAAEIDRRKTLIDSWYVEARRGSAAAWKMKMEDGFTFFGDAKKDYLMLNGRLLDRPPMTWDLKKISETRTIPAR